MGKKDMILALVEHYSGGNKAQFANRLGISPQGLSTWLKRESFDNELIFSKCEGVNPEWLLTGNGPMLKQDETTDTTPSAPMMESPELPATVGAPYYDVDFLGGFTELVNDQTTLPASRVYIQGFERADLWCNVTGHSMEPKISHGDIIGLHRCTIRDIQYGETYAVVLDGDIRTVKILRKSPDPDMLRFVPVNISEFDEQEFPKARIRTVFEVIGAVKKFF